MMRLLHKILLFLALAFPLSSVAQTLEITKSFKMNEFSTVLTTYKNEFGYKIKQGVKDNAFPYAVIEVHLKGDARAVTAAKEKLSLDMGALYMVEGVTKEYNNKIVFLVSSSVRTIYMECGDGCEKQAIFEGMQLKPDRIYSGEVRYTLGDNPDPISNKKQYFTFRVTPSNATVQVHENGEWQLWEKEDGLFSKSLYYGRYSYKVSADRFQIEEGTIELSDTCQEKVVKLLPDYGWLTISSSPISQGASVFLADARMNEPKFIGTIPLSNKELDKGDYTLQIQQAKYKKYTQSLTIRPNETTTIEPVLLPNFVSLTLSTDPQSDLYVDGKWFGKGTWTGTLELGEYSVESRKEHHRAAVKIIRIGDEHANQTIEIESPKPIYGSLHIKGTPSKAEVYVDDKYVGKSPIIVNDLLIGEHNVKVEKEECSKFEASVVIKEHQEELIDYKLEKGFIVENFEAEGFNTLNVRVHLDKSQFVFTYDLQEQAPIYLLMAVNGSKDYQYVCGAEGAIGENIMPGTNLQITWNPLEFNEQFIVQDVRFRIEAHFKFTNRKVLIGDFYYRAAEDGTSVELMPKSRIYGKNYDLSKYTTRDYSPVRIPEYVSYKGFKYWITRIADHAFQDCHIDRDIDIPETVKSIGDMAFWGNSIKGIHTSNHVEELGRSCFGANHHLSTVIVGENVHKINYNALKYNLLERLSVHPNNITYDSRDNCNAIIESYTNKLIQGSSATSIPQSVTNIGSNAFMYNYKLSEIIIPDGVTRIEDGAFWGCDRLHSLTIPNSVNTIEYSAFYGCDSLTTISIGNNVTNIGYHSFHNTLWYKNQPNGPMYIDGVLYSYKGNMPKNAHMNIKSGTLFIGSDAFANSKNLKSITVPYSVKCIDGRALIGTQWYKKQSDGLVYINDILYRYKGKMPKNSSIQIKNGTKSISSYAFNGCANLNVINIPNSVVHIGNTAFQQCENLTILTLPSGILAIEDYTFSGCTKLNSLVIPNTVKRIGICAFANCDNLTELHIPEGVDIIEERAFVSCNALNCITIPSSVTTIGRGILWRCDNLKSIMVEDTNPIFDSRENCNAIIVSRTNTLIVGCNVTVIPNSVKHIGNYAFNGCDKMTSIAIPNSVESVGTSPFSNCSNLTTIYIPKGTKAKFAAMGGLKDHVDKLVER